MFPRVGQAGILTEADRRCDRYWSEQPVNGEIEASDVHVFARVEDIHMNVESRLRELIGPAAGLRCTRRARATTRWRPTSGSWCATPLIRVDGEIKALQHALAERALEVAGRVMPGFTHLQSAQPVTFGHHLLAYVEMFGRDRGRLTDARERLNDRRWAPPRLAGTSFLIDREATAAGARLGRRPTREFARCGV